MKVRINKNSILLYLILIPFLHPRGFDEYFPTYKAFFTDWLYVAIILIGLYFIFTIVQKKEKFNNSLYAMLIYYFVLVLVTLIIQDGFNSGLQKMFAAPALCIVVAMLIKSSVKEYVDALANLLLIVLSLNVFVFNTIFFDEFFTTEVGVLFIGHIQIASQLGILGIYIGYIVCLFNGKWTFKSKFLIFCSILTMIMSDTAASKISLGVMLLGIIYIHYSSNAILLKYGSKIYIVGYLLINSLLLIYLYINNWKFNVLGLHINGRGYVWQKAYEKIIENPIFGYGVKGVYFKVFWSEWKGDGSGMNYAHSQILQQFLDGGIILFVLFLLFLFFYTKPIKSVKNKKLLMFSNLLLSIILFVMIFESLLEYYYILFLLSMFAYLPEVEKYIKNNST